MEHRNPSRRLTYARRALWVAVLAAFAWLTVAYYDWHPVQMLIAFGLCVLAIPLDRLIELELNTRLRNPSPFGPVNKWGMREQTVHSSSPYWTAAAGNVMSVNEHSPEVARGVIVGGKPAEWWSKAELFEHGVSGELIMSNRYGTRSVNIEAAAIARRAPWWRRMFRPLRAWWVWTTAAGLIIGGALYFSAPANATPLQDVAFLRTLDNQGIAYSSASKVIAAGYTVCQMLDEGDTFIQVATEVYTRTRLDVYNAGYFTGAAIGAYCPEHSHLIPHSGQLSRA